jgi:hypothetical protein
VCVSFCHKRRVLFFTHEDCPPLQCRWTDPALWGRCEDCRYGHNGRCGLTNIPLPVPGGGCCHRNVSLVGGEQVIGPEQVQLLPAFGTGQTAAEILGSYGVSYDCDGDGRPLIDPNELVLPVVYGRGSDPIADGVSDLKWVEAGDEKADLW